MNYFITGTDTGVGKTLVACALLHAYAAQGQRVVGMKPVAAGCDTDGVNADVKQLRAASNIPVSFGQINPYNFLPAVAPHIAAHDVGVTIDLARIVVGYQALAAQADVVIVEGVGGFKVPLNEHEDSTDLVRKLGLPVIVVVGMRLGCLNHALLTVSAIQASGLKCAGWIANSIDRSMSAMDGNIQALQQRIAAPLLGVIPFQAQPDAQQIILQTPTLE